MRPALRTPHASFATCPVNLTVNRVNLVNLTFQCLQLPRSRGANYPRAIQMPEGPMRKGGWPAPKFLAAACTILQLGRQLTHGVPEKHRLLVHHQFGNEANHHKRRQNLTTTKSAPIRITITTIKGSLLIVTITTSITSIMIIVATVTLDDARFTESCCSHTRSM